MTDLICPDCSQEGYPNSRIGNRRGRCALCNRFSQAVLRASRAALAERHPEEFAAIRTETERNLYYGTIGATADERTSAAA